MMGTPTGQRRGHSPRVLLLLLILIVLAAGIMIRRLRTASARHEEGWEPYIREFPIFGTSGRITLWAPREVAEMAADHAVAELCRLHAAVNIFDEHSELSELNRSALGAPFRCSDRLWRVLQACRKAYTESQGAFDISVGPLMKLWGFHRRRSTMPAREDVLAAQQAVGLDKVVFDNDAKSVQFTQPGSCLDVGGMVKGYALDVVVQRLRICGIHTGMVDLGGNVFCLEGPPPGRKAYSIGVRHPFDRGRLLGTCHLLNCAVSTSGSYEQFVEFSGKRFTHIVDPRTGYPVPDVASVSVVTPRGVDSDVYSTAVFVAGEALVTRFRRTHARTAVLVVNLDPTGQALVHRYGWVWPGFPP